MKRIWKIITGVLNGAAKVASKTSNPIVSAAGTVVDELIPDKENKKRKSNKKQK
jgi:hypothetical protein